MRRNQKILVTVLWGVAVLGILALVAGGLWTRHDNLPDIKFDGPKFSLTDQLGRNVTDANLHGNVWIAMVFFTQCPGVCPMISSRMEQLEKAVSRPDIKIVSFSVDPEHDTPEAMKAYADKFSADPNRWYMLTGPKDTMFDIARNGLKLTAMPATGGNPIVHSQQVLLIDREDHVRAVYDTNDDDSMKKLAEDAQNLAAETSG